MVIKLNLYDCMTPSFIGQNLHHRLYITLTKYHVPGFILIKLRTIFILLKVLKPHYL